MENKKEILESLEKELAYIKNKNDLANVKALYLGKSGIITNLTMKMKDIPNDEKKEYGKFLNEIKDEVIKKLDLLNAELERRILDEKLKTEEVDVTLPSTNIPVGAPNIIEKVIEDLEELLMSMGYDVVEGPELEKDLYNFELLNLPKGHPARDAQDTFYTKGEELLLRSQTSPVQVRTMLKEEEKKPIRIICPGKTYRRDDDDATHSHQFAQLEGLLIDENISLAHLKGTFDVIAKHLFGKSRETRFRPSYYPFTEPSVEMDISCFNCDSKGCPLCKKTGWITVGGAGVVNPTVLENGGYDPNIWSGFAFGFGIERLAMLKYNITDIRTFYNTDLRNNYLFDRKEETENGN